MTDIPEPAVPLDPANDPALIAMTPADAGLYLAGLAQAESRRNKRKRQWEGFANLCAFMIQQAFDAGYGAHYQETLDDQRIPDALAVRTFRCDCADPAPGIIVDGADLDAVSEVRCNRCGKAMTEVIGG